MIAFQSELEWFNAFRNSRALGGALYGKLMAWFHEKKI